MSELASVAAETSTLIARKDDLDLLFGEANREHALVIRDLSSATEHAFAAGAALNRAFALAPEGQWGQWLGEHFEGSETMARLYRRMDLYSEVLASKGIKTVAAAKSFLAQAALHLQPDGGRDYGGRRNFVHARILTPAEIAEIRSLRKAGVTQKRIAEIVGVGRTTVQHHTTGSTAKRREEERKRRQRRAAERAALERENRVKEAKKVSKDLGDFYSRLRIFAQDLDRCISRCEYREVRKELTNGYHYLQRSEECIGRAVRLPQREVAA